MFESTKCHLTCFFILILLGCKPYASEKTRKIISCPPDSFQALKQSLQYNSTYQKPWIMAHKGGPAMGFPENSLVAFQRTISNVDCPMIEFDVRMTKDSVLILSHDDELERCTNGQGLISESNWTEIQNLRLKDIDHNLTENKIPTFKETLKWFEKKSAILIIDAKPSTPLDLIIKEIANSSVKNQSVLICYSIEDAEYVNKSLSDIILALGFNDAIQIEKIKQSSIPKDQILALTPRELQSVEYYEQIHDMGIICSLGTNGNIDTLEILSAKDMYHQRFEAGADIICTDNPIEVSRLFSTQILH